MHHHFGTLIRNFRLIRFRKFRGQQPAGPAGNLRNTSSVGQMFDELEWPSLEARRDQSSLLLFHKIHCGAVSIEKDKYRTPALILKTTRSSHSTKNPRHTVMPWRIPFPCELFHIRIVPCHFFTPRTKHPTKICHPGQNIPSCFCHPRHNIPCHFCHPDITSHAIFASPDKTSHTQTASSG